MQCKTTDFSDDTDGASVFRTHRGKKDSWKMRVPIPENIAAEILFQHAHTCCVCQERGKHVQIHHIDEDASNNDEDNLTVLCLECHNNTQIRGGFGRKLGAVEVRRYRDDWTKRVADNRRAADELILGKQTSWKGPVPQPADWRPLGPLELKTYIECVPDVLKTAYELAVPEWDTGSTSAIQHANYQLIGIAERMWLSLLNCYPPNQFGGKSASQYASEYIAGRYELHYALHEPAGPGTGGTMVRPMVSIQVLSDIEDVIKLTVRSLVSFGEASDTDLPNWITRFNAAVRPPRC